MKMKKILWFSTLSLLLVIATGCEKEKRAKTKEEQIFPHNLEFAVFELTTHQACKVACGENGEILISLQDVKDDVDTNCSLAQFDSIQMMEQIKIYAYLNINGDSTRLEVPSKPCGTVSYYCKDKSEEVQDVFRLIDEIRDAPAAQGDSAWFFDTFERLFGKGASIDHTPYRIYLAKADPTKFDAPHARLEDYRLIFILTTK